MEGLQLHDELKKIRAVIKEQLNTKTFFSDRPLVQDGNSVKFLIQKGTRKIEATYSDIGTHKDISQGFDSLMNALKNRMAQSK